MIEKLKHPPECVPDGDRTPFAQAMPDECKREDAVEAYKEYYRKHKRHIAAWKNRDIPEWMKDDTNG